MVKKNEAVSLDPTVDVVDEEKIVSELLEVAADSDGNNYPIADFVGDRVFTPTPGERHNGEPVDFRNDDPAVVFRLRPGTPANRIGVRRFSIEFFCLGGSEPGSTRKSRVRAKQVYRALVARLKGVDNESVASGVVLWIKETSSGVPEIDPGTGNWWTYRSTWAVGLR